MTNYFISDTHFGHKNIINFCDRPFDSVAHMNELMISNWNAVVSDEDTVYHLGDVALGPWTGWDSILTRLNGYKVLVAGNHDRIFQGMKLNQREKFIDVYAEWFDEIYDDSAIDDWELANGEIVSMSHFPYEGDHMDEARFMEYRLDDKGQVLVHGHTHAPGVISHSKRGTVQIHVGVDAHNFSPVSEDQLINYIKIAREA